MSQSKSSETTPKFGGMIDPPSQFDTPETWASYKKEVGSLPPIERARELAEIKKAGH